MFIITISEKFNTFMRTLVRSFILVNDVYKSGNVVYLMRFMVYQFNNTQSLFLVFATHNREQG